MSAFRLVVERGRSKGRYFRLRPNQSATLGREAKNDLAFKDPQTSRKHCRIEGKLGEFVLTDLKSSNGTFVNGERHERVTLAAGDRIALGESLVCFLPETDEDRTARRGPLTGEELAGYRIGRVLGRGGMGTVYEAVQLSLERTVALKVLAPELRRDPARVERFVAEARAAGRLNNAHLVGVFDVVEADGQPLISMELMAGGSLEDMLRERGGPIPLEETIPLLFDAARGLEYAAAQGLVHRDVKPANLMRTEGGVVKLCDLGLAIFTSRQHDVSGSPHYIAPEQALGEDLDGRADLYALGASWVELLSNATLFAGASAGELARKQVEEPIPDLQARIPGLPDDVAALLAKLLEKSPADRYPSARQLQRDLLFLAERHASPDLARRLERLAPRIEASEWLAPPEPEEVLAPPIDREALKAWLPWVGAALLMFLLCAGVTWGVVGARAATEIADAAALKSVVDLEGLAVDEPVKAEVEVGDVIDSLSAEGYPELAERAREVAAFLVARRRKEALAEREVAAGQLVDSAEELCEGEVGPSADPSLDLATQRLRLEEALRLVSEVVKRDPDTQACDRAQALRGLIVEALERIEVAERARQGKVDAARAAFEVLAGRVRASIAQPKKGNYAAAHASCLRYLEDHGAVERKKGVALMRWVERKTEEAVRGAVKRSRRLVLREAWEDAAAALDVVWPPLGQPKLAADVRQAASEVQAALRASRAAKAQRLRQLSVAVVAKAKEAAAPFVEARRYGDGARELRSSLSRIKVTDLRRLTELRATRLEGAQRVLDRLSSHVAKGSDPPLWIDLEVAGKLRRVRASAVDPVRRYMTFALTKQILRDVALTALSEDDLLTLTAPLAVSGATHLDQASLAYELSRSMVAERHCTQARGLDPSLAKAVEDLRILAGAGE
ncbi:MAG: protein kinase [Planctomycetes bacterium]|nr:protein kinase [Planctomycetota bacterium]